MYILQFSGTIAEREHRKWVEKAVPLSNNPYSKESLEKRLSKTSVDSGTSTLHSRLDLRKLTFVFVFKSALDLIL